MLTCKITVLTRHASFWEVLSMWSEVFWAGGQGIFAWIFLICCFQKTFFKQPQLTCLMVIVSIYLRGIQPMGQLVHLNIRFRTDFLFECLNLNFITCCLYSNLHFRSGAASDLGRLIQVFPLFFQNGSFSDILIGKHLSTS